ncbi:Uncharacterized protein TCM_038818 [Theobroma cacao]|uniref:Reverse transcriptase/retrotransposon-derived protein RNase H-like domain-containing protein n=1 Tax=Theobroma cacao TaxID=3641 RepID=A0A061GQR0_THECC|nr:Uncharacterized protein TCM_038818 [Theobroma cacao]
MIVRAFDGTRREMMGDIEMLIEIGPCTFTLEFQVMDIVPSYNYLLGWPWIHMAGAIPSSFYQKVKFIMDGKIVCINREEYLLIIKECLLNSPILVPHVIKRHLILYLTINKRSMGCVLGQHNEIGKKEKVVHYFSKKFTNYEFKHSPLEKMCYALAWTTHRLRQYM